jgi:hypothetical protein
MNFVVFFNIQTVYSALSAEEWDASPLHYVWNELLLSDIKRWEPST